MRWMQTVETRGHVEGGRVVQWQATIKAGLTLNE
jgi:hypothetical protein